MRKSRWKFRLLVVLAVLLFVPLAGLAWVWQPSPPLILSRETTYITNPLLSDGRPDYAGWVNRVCSEGVTPENNAAVAIVKLLSTAEFANDHAYGLHRPELLAELGITFDVSDGLIPWRENEDEPPKSWDDGIPREDLNTFIAADHPRIVAWLAANTHALDTFATRIQACDRFYHPLIPVSELEPDAGVPLPLSGELFRVSRTFSFRSRERLQRGDIDGAIDDGLVIVRTTRLAAHIPLRVAVDMASHNERMGLECCEQALLSPQIRMESVARLKQMLAQLPDFPDLVRCYDTGERKIWLDGIASSRTTDRQWKILGQTDSKLVTVQLAPGADVNVMLRSIGSEIDEICKAFGIADPQARRRAIQAIADADRVTTDANFSTRVKHSVRTWRNPQDTVPLFPGNVRSMLNLGKRAFDLNTLTDATATRRTLLDVAIAVTEFRLQQGQLPESLDQLVPSHLASVPVDLWTGQPLRYMPIGSTFTLLSTGPNGIDDGGWESSDQNHPDNADDIRFGPLPGK